MMRLFVPNGLRYVRMVSWLSVKPPSILACENSRPSSLLARVAFRETPLGPGAKKDGCFRRLHLFFPTKDSAHFDKMGYRSRRAHGRFTSNT